MAALARVQAAYRGRRLRFRLAGFIALQASIRRRGAMAAYDSGVRCPATDPAAVVSEDDDDVDLSEESPQKDEREEVRREETRPSPVVIAAREEEIRFFLPTKPTAKVAVNIRVDSRTGRRRQSSEIRMRSQSAVPKGQRSREAPSTKKTAAGSASSAALLLRELRRLKDSVACLEDSFAEVQEGRKNESATPTKKLFPPECPVEEALAGGDGVAAVRAVLQLRQTRELEVLLARVDLVESGLLSRLSGTALAGLFAAIAMLASRKVRDTNTALYVLPWIFHGLRTGALDRLPPEIQGNILAGLQHIARSEPPGTDAKEVAGEILAQYFSAYGGQQHHETTRGAAASSYFS